MHHILIKGISIGFFQIACFFLVNDAYCYVEYFFLPQIGASHVRSKVPFMLKNW